MKLPYPFKSGDRTVTSVDLKSPTGGVLADTRKCADNGDVYTALLTYVVGSVSALRTDDGDSIEGKDLIRSALRGLPWALGEHLAITSMLKSGAQDEVDIPFQCPRCGNAYYREDDPVKISDLRVAQSDEPPVVDVSLTGTVEFTDSRTKEVIESVSALRFRLPTMGDCIRAAGAVGGSDDTRLQYAIWAEAITAVNGTEIDQKWRAAWGTQVFERMDLADVKAVAKAMGAWSVDSTVPAVCPKCGKQYRQGVPTGSFFASALREE